MDIVLSDVLPHQRDTLSMNKLLERLGEIGVIPVIALEDAKDAAPLGRALVDGGLPCAEITFRTAAAADAIRSMAAACPDMLVGAGTVLTIEQAAAAIAAGSKFIVTPGFDAAVVDYCLANEMPVVPGVMTPTEINMALSKGITVVKFFPAEVAGGVKALKAMSAPYQGVTFMPTGGVSPANLADYLGLPSVLACGGSWVTPKNLITAGEFEEIGRIAQEATNLVRQIRGA